MSYQMKNKVFQVKPNENALNKERERKKCLIRFQFDFNYYNIPFLFCWSIEVDR